MFVAFTVRERSGLRYIRRVSARYMHESEAQNYGTERLKPLPILRSDEEAERFVDTADLSQYDLSGGRRMQFEFAAKTARVNMRLPEAQLQAVKAEAQKRGCPISG